MRSENADVLGEERGSSVLMPQHSTNLMHAKGHIAIPPFVSETDSLTLEVLRMQSEESCMTRKRVVGESLISRKMKQSISIEQICQKRPASHKQVWLYHVKISAPTVTFSAA
mmetsp:Transcript_29464/g.68492  ORF Transcript_29464/g.68492 Transcript_29464/m.68492 type:complete len:112 (+) Transcript_29464:346-681(+)